LLTLSLERKQLLSGLLLSLVTVFFSSTVAAVGKHVSQEVHVSAIVLVQYGAFYSRYPQCCEPAAQV